MSDDFPDVPDYPGVPSLPRDLHSVLTTVFTALTGDLLDALLPDQWGIFDENGASVVDFDSFVSFDGKKDYRISNFPIEGGDFRAYNKVEQPGEYRVSLSCGGSVSDRSNFLSDVAILCDSITVYDVVTPEVTYSGVNATGFDYRRTATAGAGLIVVDITLEEVRQSATSQLTNTKEPQGQDDTQDGSVQPVPIDSDLAGAPT